jgi:hypothetical protein
MEYLGSTESLAHASKLPKPQAQSVQEMCMPKAPSFFLTLEP